MSRLFEKVDSFFDSQFDSKEVFEKCSVCGEYDYMNESENICPSCKRKQVESEEVTEEVIEEIENEADISVDTELTQSNFSKAEATLNDLIKTVNSDYTLEDVDLWMTPRGNINIRTKDNKDIVTVDRDNFSDSDIEELKDKGLFDAYMDYEETDMSESEEITEEETVTETEVPASELDFKHQQLAKVQADIELIAGLKSEDTSNALYTDLLDAYDKIVEVLTDAIAEDPVGTVIGTDSMDTGLDVSDEEPIEDEFVDDEITDEAPIDDEVTSEEV